MKKSKNKYGYIVIYDKSFKNGYYLEHRFIMENKIGRKLTSSEHIHHINGNKSDNRIENLEIISNGDHKRFHQHQRFAKYYAGRWSENFDACIICGLTEKVHAKQGICFRCYDKEYHKKINLKKGHAPKEIRDKFWGYTWKTKQFFTKCVICGSSKKPMLAMGKCAKCYEKSRIRK